MKLPKYITIKLLRRKKGCESEIKRHEKMFGQRLKINEANIYLLAKNSFDLKWLAEHIFSKSALEAYIEASFPAWEAYIEAKAQALEVYIEAIAQAREACIEAIAPAWMKVYKSQEE